MYINRYEYQKSVENIEVSTDPDFAGFKKNRKSTSGGEQLHGARVINSWSTNQAIVALSSGEA